MIFNFWAADKIWSTLNFINFQERGRNAQLAHIHPMDIANINCMAFYGMLVLLLIVIYAESQYYEGANKQK